MTLSHIQKRVLFLCHRIPYPPNKGDKIRSFNEIKLLSKVVDVDLVTLADDPDELRFKKELASFCKRVFVLPLKQWKAVIRGSLSLITGGSISQAWFYETRVQRIVDTWLRNESYQAIICFSSPMAEYVFRSSLDIKSLLIMDFCDLDSDKWTQYSLRKRFPLNHLYKIEGRRLLEYEKNIEKRFDRSIFVSHAELNLFRKVWPFAKKVSVMMNGVDSDYFCKSSSRKNTGFDCLSTSHHPVLMFSGAMDYYANIDGVIWFVNKVLPLIQIRYPDLHFMVVGSNPHNRIRLLQKNPAISVTGYVDDIRVFYERADICVIPLRIARGVQNKVLEAMAMEKPVVVTGPAVQGITPQNGRDCLVADYPEAFADAVIQLLENKQTMISMGKAARRYVVSHHSWQNNLQGFRELLTLSKD